MVPLRRRRVPHRQDAVAEVRDDDAGMLDDPLRLPLHHVADQPAGVLRAELLRQRRKAAQVAHEDGHFLAAALQQRRVARQLAHQLRREELLELGAHARGDRAGQVGAGGGGQQLHQLRLQRPDFDALDPAVAAAQAVQHPHHLVLQPENRRGHHGVHAHEAFLRLHQGQVLVEGLLPRQDLGEDRLAELAAADGGPVVAVGAGGAGGDLPALVAAQQDKPDVQADHVDQGVRGLGVEFGRAGVEALQGQHRLHPPREGFRRRGVAQAGKELDRLRPANRLDGQVAVRCEGFRHRRGGRRDRRRPRGFQPARRGRGRLGLRPDDDGRLAHHHRDGKRDFSTLGGGYFAPVGEKDGVARAKIMEGQALAGQLFHAEMVARYKTIIDHEAGQLTAGAAPEFKWAGTMFDQAILFFVADGYKEHGCRLNRR